MQQIGRVAIKKSAIGGRPRETRASRTAHDASSSIELLVFPRQQPSGKRVRRKSFLQRLQFGQPESPIEAAREFTRKLGQRIADWAGATAIAGCTVDAEKMGHLHTVVVTCVPEARPLLEAAFPDCHVSSSSMPSN